MKKHNVDLNQKRGNKSLGSKQKPSNCPYIFIVAI